MDAAPTVEGLADRDVGVGLASLGELQGVVLRDVERLEEIGVVEDGADALLIVGHDIPQRDAAGGRRAGGRLQVRLAWQYLLDARQQSRGAGVPGSDRERD